MIHDPKSIIIAFCIAGVIFLAGCGFIAYGLALAMGGLWL